MTILTYWEKKIIKAAFAVLAMEEKKKKKKVPRERSVLHSSTFLNDLQ